MSIRSMSLVMLALALISTAGCGADKAAPSPSPAPAPTPPPTAPTIPLTMTAPRGNAPTLDGILSPGEWDSARRETLSDDSELLLMQDGEYLYLGIRANLKPPEGLKENQCVTMWTVYIERGGKISVLHSSASLGTAVYTRTDSDWKRTRTFDWVLRREAAQEQRKQFLETEGWLASLCATGKLEEAEFQLAIPEGSLRLAVAFPLPPTYAKAALWPAGLDDDAGNIRLLEGNAPARLRLSLERWMTVTVAPVTEVRPPADS